MRLSLRTKFSMLVLGLILVMMGSIWLISIDQQSAMESSITEHQRNTMRGELRKRAANIFSFLAANSEALAIGDYLTVDAFVRDMSADTDIRFVYLVKKGKIVVPISETGEPKDFEPPAWLNPAGGKERFDLVEIPGGERLLIASGPIIDKSINTRVADAYVGISRNPIQAAIADAQEQVKTSGRVARHNFTFATLVFAVIGVIGAVFLVTYVVRPINTLAAGAKIIGDGNLDHIVTVHSNDEVGDLAGMFNLMTRNLKEDQAQLVEKEKLEQELKMATQIQQTLLPKSLPRVAGYNFGAVYTSAREIGGDYYDFIDLQNAGHSRIAVVVADVAGKGVPGAVMMAVTRSVLRARASNTRSPPDVLKSTNAILRPDMKKGMFVSMFYGLLDTTTGKMEFSSAGHNPTLIYRAKSGKIESIKCKGLALGIGDSKTFDRLIENKEAHLNPGDMLFQYTDGIPHAVNERGERFGMGRLHACILENTSVQAQALVDTLLGRVRAFTAGYPPFDDITMVAVKRSADIREV